MASPNESPDRGYPRPDKNLLGPSNRAFDRSPSFAFNVSPSPSLRYYDRPLTPSPVFRNALLQPPRRRHFPNTDTPTTTATSSSHGKFSCLIIASVLLFIVLVVSIPIMVFYVFGPRAPTFSVEQVSIYDPIFYESSTRAYTGINITVKVSNSASHVGVFYENVNSIVASYSGMRLCSGVIPPSFHRPMEDMFMQSTLTGMGVVVSDDMKHKLEADHKKQRVPLTLDMMSMVKYKMGSITSRAVLKVSCYLVLENLIQNNTPTIYSRSCDSIAGFWFPTIRE